MNAYERLEDEACRDGIDVIQRRFKSDRIKGLCCDDTIAIHKNIETTTQKACVLLEEMGHYNTTVGDISDLSKPQNRKQERQARLWAYNKQIGLYGLIRAYEGGCKNRYEIADYLEVTEEFLQEAIDCYRSKYGTGTMLDNYYIMFIPNLQILKLI